MCPVSVVSQWYDEAMDKTREGTLKVYQYYGGKRTTDPSILKDNDIVITTYQVLVSDMNARAASRRPRSRGKAGRTTCLLSRSSASGALYWTKVACDQEENTAMAKAVRMLSAHRRWCVSGTPAPLSLENLQSQFKFLGCDSVASDMSRFKHF